MLLENLSFLSEYRECVAPRIVLSVSVMCVSSVCTFMHFFPRDKKIVELGGGMTCLAGIAVSTSFVIKEIDVTDHFHIVKTLFNSKSIPSYENICFIFLFFPFRLRAQRMQKKFS